jgi:hypothetical protein
MKSTKVEVILANARLLARGLSEDDSLARAVIAVQNSSCGSARKISGVTASLKGLNALVVMKIDVNLIRAIVMKETGLNIALDDPFLLMLVAIQDIDLDGLKNAALEIKQNNADLTDKNIKLKKHRWILALVCIAMAAIEAVVIYTAYRYR